LRLTPLPLLLARPVAARPPRFLRFAFLCFIDAGKIEFERKKKGRKGEKERN
jgi:hypothetical protein